MFCCLFIFFFFNDTATTEIYTLSLHDALPISANPSRSSMPSAAPGPGESLRSIVWFTGSARRESISCRRAIIIDGSIMRLPACLLSICVTLAAQQARAPVRSFVTLYTIADGTKKVIYSAEGFYQAPNWSP